MVQATSADQRVLRGKAMECISLIGIAVGKEMFKNDVTSLMDLLSSIKTVDLAADDPQRDFIVETWMRISTCLGEDFVPYLQYVVPPLIQTAESDPQISVSDGSIVVPGEAEVGSGWDFVDVGEQRVKIHTVALEEKASACNRLLCFASEMKDGFFPFVEQVSKVMQPLMDYHFHDGVRIAAMAIVPHLINCAKLYSEKHGGNYHHSLFAFLFPALIESIREETETETLTFAIESVHKTLSILGPNTLNQDQVNSIIHDASLLITCSINRRKQLTSHDPDEDEERNRRSKDEIEEEDDVLSELAEIIVSLLSKSSSSGEKQLSLCIFDDLVEHGKALSFPLWDTFMPFMIAYATDPHNHIRQAACYGLGVCAQEGGDRFKPVFRPALEALVSTIQKPNSRVDETVGEPTENAISSVGKILRFQTSCFSSANELQEVATLWVNWLPLEYDEVEAKAVHLQFCQLIVSHSAVMLGPQSSNLPKILTIFATLIAGHELIDDIKVVTQLVSRMQAEMPAELLEAAYSVLPQEHQETLRAIPK